MLFFLLACTPLAGDWSGEYVGEGWLDCTDAYGGSCEQSFELQVEPEGPLGEQELDVDIDDCTYELEGTSGSGGCTNPDDVEWDGADSITGEWDDCDVELERD
jgi:hypothetical protein